MRKASVYVCVCVCVCVCACACAVHVLTFQKPSGNVMNQQV